MCRRLVLNYHSPLSLPPVSPTFLHAQSAINARTLPLPIRSLIGRVAMGAEDGLENLSIEERSNVEERKVRSHCGPGV